MVFVTSADGLTWSAPASVGMDIQTIDANWVLAYDAANNKLWVIASIDYNGNYWQDGLKGRRGAPNADGTITWDAPWQTILATGSCASDYTAVVDAAGHLWIGYMAHGAGNNMGVGDAWVLKNSATDGTWATDTGFPVQLTSSNDSRFALLVALGSGAAYAVVTKWGAPAAKATGYLFADGSATLTGEGNISGSNVESTSGGGTFVARIAAYGTGDGVTHLVYQDTAARILYAQRAANGTLAAEVVLDTGVESAVSSPQVAMDDTGNLYVFYTRSGRVYGMKKTGGTWGAPVIVFVDAYNAAYERLSISREVKNNQILAKVNGSGGTLRVRILSTSTLFAVPNDTSNFALLAGSAAIDAGTALGLTKDILGKRIGTPDIGAYER
jgi:hypothetical protein